MTRNARFTLPALLLLTVPSSTLAADIVGTWSGGIEAQGIKITTVVHVSREDDSFQVSLDSPDQGAFGLEADAASFVDGVLSFEIKLVGGRYEGRMETDGSRIVGTWYQGGGEYPLVLEPSAGDVAPNRPQTPKPPFPYASEDVVIANPSANIELGATLTIPGGEGPFPGVVLVTGSGPQDRDESLMAHKPFLVIADHLARAGIAALRYDDRGIGGSTGDFAGATTFDFATDAGAAVEYLMARPEIDSKAVGIIGHSEGGLVGPLVALESEHVAFVVMLAGPAVSGWELLLEQTAAIARVGGMSKDMVKEVRHINKRLYVATMETDTPQATLERVREILAEERERLGPDVTAMLGASEDAAEDHAAALSSPWLKEFLRYDPTEALTRMKAPLLALFGGKDLQVVASQHAPALRKIRPQATVVVYDDLNHLFQHAKTGSVSEYKEIEETMASEVLEQMATWILQQAN